MEKFNIKNLDPLDIEAAIFKIEKSFDLKLKKFDFSEVETFGEFSDVIINKIQLKDIESCTKQQAFYKIRKAVTETFDIENIKPETKLTEIFPRKNRRKNIKKFEQVLGFKTNVLNPKISIIIILSLIFLLSLICFYFDWKIALSGITISLLGFKLASIFGKEFHLNTIRELSEKITTENYIKSRSNSNSFNKKEIESIIVELFCKETAIEKHELTRESSFI